MKITPIAAAAALTATSALAGGLISSQRPETQTSGQLTVSTASFKAGGAIPKAYTPFGADTSPALRWSEVPAARSYAVLVDDPDAPGPQPVSHWVAFNIPSNITMIAEGSKVGLQGTNTHKSVGYTGPHPPAGDPPHHYHFQVLALDRMLAASAGADREAVLAAAKGHVVAKGEVVGTFQAPKG